MMKSPLDTYAETQRAGLTGRALEAAILLKCARQLNETRESLEKGDAFASSEALIVNRRMWEVLMLSATDATNPLPHDTKRAIANIGLFILRHTFTQLAKPTAAGLATLIEINRTLAEGLAGRPHASAP